MRLLAAIALGVLLGTLLVPRISSSHWKPRSLHNRIHAVHAGFCGTSKPCALGWQAVRVAKCESGWSMTPRANNGQYLGMFQMGSYARSRFGHSHHPWGQARAAARYYREAGWSPWSCAFIVGIL